MQFVRSVVRNFLITGLALSVTIVLLPAATVYALVVRLSRFYFDDWLALAGALAITYSLYKYYQPY